METRNVVTFATSIFLAVLPFGNAWTNAVHSSQRLGWDYWIDRFHPGQTAAPTVATTTRPAPTEPPFPPNLLQSHVSEKDINNAQCGVPRKGGADPFDLTNVNLNVWNQQTRGRGNLSVDVRIVGGSKIDPRQACWQVWSAPSSDLLELIQPREYLGQGKSESTRDPFVRSMHYVHNISDIESGPQLTTRWDRFHPAYARNSYLTGDIQSYGPLVSENYNHQPGTETLKTVPWCIAKIQRDNNFICGASIIGKQTIMTAMHCVRNPRGAFPTDIYQPNRFRVTVGAPKSDTDVPGGSQDPTGCAQDFAVIRIVGNSRFNTVTNENDIAIMTLEKEIDFNRDCVCPICLKSTLPKVGEICSVSGYGLLQEGGPAAVPRPLKYVHLNILPTNLDSNCYIQEDSGNTLNLNNILCAGDVPGEDSCQGDSGGPVVCQDPVTRKHYQAGIVSYGSGCARGVGGVYTRVSSFLQWINLNSGGDLLSFPK